MRRISQNQILSKYTLEIILKLNEKIVVLLLIHHNLYDMTKLLKEHPKRRSTYLTFETKFKSAYNQTVGYKQSYDFSEIKFFC